MAVTYDVYIGPQGNLSLISSAQAGTTKVVDTEDVPWGVDIYWRVDSTNEYGTTTGDTWSFSNVVVQGIGLGSAGDFIVAAAINGIYISTDQGANWARKTPDAVETTDWTKGICSSDGTYIIVVSDANAIYRSANSGTAWGAITPAGGDTFVVNDLAISDDGQFVVIVGQNSTDPTESCYISTDYGVTWTAKKPVAASVEWTECDISNDGSDVSVSTSAYIYISIDSGTTWGEQNMAAAGVDWACFGISGDGTKGIVVNTDSNDDVFIGTKTDLYSLATWAEAAITSAARGLMDDTTQGAQQTTLGVGTGDSPTFTGLTLSAIAAEATDVDKFLVDSTGVIKFRTGAEVLSDIGASASGHLHDTATLEHDGVNSDGGAFAFNTTGAVTFNQSVAAANYSAANLLTVAATNAGELDFTAASKKLDVEDNAVVSQDYSSDASPQFTGIELGHASDTTLTRVSAGLAAIEGTTIMMIGDPPTAHVHDGDTLQLDGVNSNGGAFPFATSGAVNFSNNITIPDAGYIGSVSDTDAIKIEAAGNVDYTNKIRSLGGGTTYPAAGTGIEIFYHTGQDQGTIMAYDRTGGAYKNMALGVGGQQIFLSGAAGAYVGINTGSPNELVEIVGGGSVNAWLNLTMYHNTETVPPKLKFRKAEGTEASHATPVDDNTILGAVEFYGYDGDSWALGAKAEGRIDGTPGGTSMPAEYTIWTTPVGSQTPVERIAIKPTGAVTLTADAYLQLTQRAGVAIGGDLWNDSTQKALQMFTSGIEQTLMGCIFTQTAHQTIANTTTETTMFGTGVGTLTLPANFWVVGKTVRIEIHGDFADTGNPTAEIQAYYGTTSLIDSGAITLSGLGGTEEWECHIIITCRSVGGTGTLETIIDWEYETTTGSSAIERLDVAGTTTVIDTTASGVLDATFQWGTAVAANTLHSHVGLVEVLN